MAETTKAKKLSVEVDGQTLIFTFAHDGAIVPFNTLSLARDLRERAAMHGFEQKLRDAAAGAEASECQGLVQKVWDSLAAGEWSARREGAPREEPTDLLARAVILACETTNRPVPSFEKAKATIESMDRSGRAKLRAGAAVAAALSALKGASDSPLDAFGV